MPSPIVNPNPPQTYQDEFLGTVNPRGAITIPIQVRKLLKIKPNDRILFRIDEGQVSLEPLPMSLEDVMGSVPPLGDGRDDDLDARIREAKEDHYAEKYKKQNW